jgi:hypothetical protein
LKVKIIKKVLEFFIFVESHSIPFQFSQNVCLSVISKTTKILFIKCKIKFHVITHKSTNKLFSIKAPKIIFTMNFRPLSKFSHQ